jgi:hypothetical protein
MQIGEISSEVCPAFELKWAVLAVSWKAQPNGDASRDTAIS